VERGFSFAVPLSKFPSLEKRPAQIAIFWCSADLAAEAGIDNLERRASLAKVPGEIVPELISFGHFAFSDVLGIVI
jgi:hypothetical protein